MEKFEQREWTEEQLLEAGFKWYERKPELLMATVCWERRVIKATWGDLIAEPGDIIIVEPDVDCSAWGLWDYHHWPIAMDNFLKNYEPWPYEKYFDNDAAEELALYYGCFPVIRIGGIWAKPMELGFLAKSRESAYYDEYPAGAWLCIDSEGGPYVQDEFGFRGRYSV